MSSVDVVLKELETALTHRRHEWAAVAESSIRRAIKFLDGLKYEDGVNAYGLNNDAVRVDGEAKNGNWSVYFLPNGRFRITCDMNMSGDTRIRKVLKALGER